MRRAARDTAPPAGRRRLWHGLASCGVPWGLAGSPGGLAGPWLRCGDAEQGVTGPTPQPAAGGATAPAGSRDGRGSGEGTRCSSAAQPPRKPQDRTPPARPGPSDPARRTHGPFTALLLAPGRAPQPAPRGLVPAPRSPRPGLLRANFPIQLSPQRGERRGAGRRERGGPAGRAAYPEARPAESLHGRGRGAKPPPGPTPGTKRGGRSRLLPSWAGRGRGGAGPARPVPPSPPAAGGASAAAPLQSPPQAGRSRPGPRRPGEASSGSGAAARRFEASPQPVGQPGQGEGDRRPRCGGLSEAEHPRRVSQGGRGAATALLPPLKPGCHCRDVASPRVTSLWKYQAPRRV